MGYNTAFLMIEGVSAGGAIDLFDSRFDAADLFASPNESISFEVAAAGSLHPNLALGKAGGWAIFWDPSARLLASGFPAAVLGNHCVFTGLLSSVSSQYRCGWFVGGAERPEAVLAAGAGLEIPVWGRDENFVFGVMARLTGVSLEKFAAALYQRLEFLGS